MSDTVSVEQAAAELLGTTPDTGDKPADKEAENTSVAADEEVAPAEAATTDASESKSDVSLSRVQKIVDTKFGGDYDKFVDSLYEQQNSAARIREELDEIKHILKTPPPVEVSEEVDEDHPDLAWFATQSTALDADRQSNNQKVASTLLEIGKTDKEIARTEGELLRADPEEKPALEAKKSNLEAKLDRLYDKWEDQKDKDGKIIQQKSLLEKQKKDVEKTLKAEKAQQQRLESERQTLQTKTVSVFEDAVVAEAKAHGLPADAQEHMSAVIAAEASYYLRSLPPNSPAIDIPAFVKHRAEAYVKTIENLTKTKFANFSKEKLQTKTEVAPKGTQAPKKPEGQPAPQTGSTKPWTKEFVRDRASKILGG